MVIWKKIVNGLILYFFEEEDDGNIGFFVEEEGTMTRPVISRLKCLGLIRKMF